MIKYYHGFGFELIEEIITKYSNGKIIILNKSEEISQEEELVKDVMAIMNVYVAKINGLRRYKKLYFYQEISSLMLLVATLKKIKLKKSFKRKPINQLRLSP